MPVTVIIQQVVVAGDGNYTLRGTVDGRGYSITVPARHLDALGNKSAKQMALAKLLLAHDEMLRPPTMDLAGTIVL